MASVKLVGSRVSSPRADGLALLSSMGTLLSSKLSASTASTCQSHKSRFLFFKFAFSTRHCNTELAIFAARGLRSGSAEITAVFFTACRDWQFFSKNEMRKLDIFQVVSNMSLVADEKSEHLETQIARVERRKLC